MTDQDRILVMKAALLFAGEKFAYYAENHMAKNTPESIAKARVNYDAAKMCLDALNA